MPTRAISIDAARFQDEASPFLSVRKLAADLGLTLAELATLAGISRNTLTARSEARTVSETYLADLTDPDELTVLSIAPAVHACEWRADLAAGVVPRPIRCSSASSRRASTG